MDDMKNFYILAWKKVHIILYAKNTKKKTMLGVNAIDTLYYDRGDNIYIASKPLKHTHTYEQNSYAQIFKQTHYKYRSPVARW